ncbi:hypothetical protein NDU88_001384 [Pleurodeles waltl]|uniref:Uncharacterized protein n=1 Tax=Pleurodeles waltl TaxID=8319 RepID=A0AAV7SBG9_PLEWA|nr:hypothetical protein NDU88_001384 [Pleurodeles waltl]
MVGRGIRGLLLDWPWCPRAASEKNIGRDLSEIAIVHSKEESTGEGNAVQNTTATGVAHRKGHNAKSLRRTPTGRGGPRTRCILKKNRQEKEMQSKIQQQPAKRTRKGTTRRASGGRRQAEADPEQMVEVAVGIASTGRS